jgi:Domain of unknown function (DUF4129)
VVTSAGPIGRDPAQRLARQELSKPVYHQTSFLDGIRHAIEQLLARLFNGASQATPGGWWTLVALAAVLVAVIAVVVTRLGPLRASARAASPLRDPGSEPLTARQHRAGAEESAADGDYSAAILQRFRAIAVSLEERQVLAPDAGRTADELAAQAAARFPGHEEGLAGAAGQFDQVRYGDGTGTRDGYERLRDLDDALSKLAPAAARPSALLEVGSAP